MTPPATPPLFRPTYTAADTAALLRDARATHAAATDPRTRATADARVRQLERRLAYYTAEGDDT